MLKFVKSHMETIAGIEIYPLISFVIFFVFFLLVTVWAITVKKEKIQELENMPLK